MKKIILLLSIFGFGSIYAASYNIVIQKKNNFNDDVFLSTGNIICSDTFPLENDVYKDFLFTEVQTNCKKEVINDLGNKKMVPIDDISLQKQGKLELSSCKEILDNGNYYNINTPSGIYSANINGTSTNLECDMVTDGGGWTKTFSRYFVGRQNGPVYSDMTSSIDMFNNINGTEVLFDLENRWFVMSGINNEEFNWMWNSGHGHEYRYITDGVRTSIGRNYQGNEVVWSHWTTEIYELNYNTTNWDTNVIFDLGIDDNHGAAFWDNANGVYKRNGGYQTPTNVTLSIFIR